MIIKFNEISFDNDVFMTGYNINSSLIFTKIDEDLYSEKYGKNFRFFLIMIHTQTDDVKKRISNIIGFENDKFALKCDDKSLLGKELNSDNMLKCYFEIK